MTEILLGMVGAVIGVGLFVGGWMFGKRQYVSGKKDALTEVELAAAEEEAKRIKEDNDAFQKLMTYGADIAYSIHPE